MKIAFSILLALLFAGPIVFLGFSALNAEAEVFEAFLEFQAADVVFQTFGYGALVATLASLIGGVWGYLVAHYDFPGRRLWLWLLPAPLAIPVYVYAFIYLGVWNSWQGYSRPGWLLVMLFSLAASPYAYLLSYQAFRREPRELRQAAELMGLSKAEYFWQIRWPLVRPLVLASFFVVLTEFIADFGAVQLFGLRTFSTAIYQLWTAYLSFGTASLVSLLLLSGVGGVLFLQSRVRGHSFASTLVLRTRPRFAWALTASAFVFTTISFIAPVVWLLVMGYEEISLNRYFLNTAALCAIFALLLTALVGIGVFVTSRKDRLIPSLLQFGYALPGTMLAVAVTVPFFYLQRWFDGFSRTVTIAIGLMLFAWSIRFLKVAWEPLAKNREQIPLNLEEAARIYEPNFFRRWQLLLFPMLRGGVLSSLLFLFIEAAKELPIALLTRPMGWETLSIRVFEYTAESQWSRAAGPALLIVLLGSLGLILLLNREESRG